MKHGKTWWVVIGVATMLLGSAGCQPHQGHQDHEKMGEKKEKGAETAEIKLTDAPAAVQQAFAKLASPESVKKVTKEEDDEDHYTYEIEYAVAGVDYSVDLSADGAVLETEKGIAMSELPPAASAALRRAYPGATFGKTVIVQKRFYEVDVVEGGKTREVKVQGTGEIKDKAKEGEKEEKDEKAEAGEKK